MKLHQNKVNLNKTLESFCVLIESSTFQRNKKLIDSNIIYEFINFLQGLTAECASNLCGNGYNRWFDKSLTVSVYENGVAGGNVEHTTADATVRISCNVRWQVKL